MTDKPSAREQVDRILADKQITAKQAVDRTIVDREQERRKQVELAKRQFESLVVEAARRGNPYAKILELDADGAPANYHPKNGRDELRSEAYRELWDFIVDEYFQPGITNLSNADGPGLGVGYSSDSDWIICYVK